MDQNKNKPWNKRDDAVLFKYYPYDNLEDIGSILGRSKKAIYERAKILKIERSRTIGYMQYVVKVKSNIDNSTITKRIFYNPKSGKSWKNRAIDELKSRYIDELLSGKYIITVTHGFNQFN